MSDFIRRHSTTLKEISMSSARLDNRSVGSTSWEKTLKQIAPILFMDWVELRWLWSDDIEDVIGAGDPNDEAFSSRHAAYCQSLADFLCNREAGRNVLGSSTSRDRLGESLKMGGVGKLGIRAIHRRNSVRPGS